MSTALLCNTPRQAGQNFKTILESAIDHEIFAFSWYEISELQLGRAKMLPEVILASKATSNKTRYNIIYLVII